MDKEIFGLWKDLLFVICVCLVSVYSIVVSSVETCSSWLPLHSSMMMFKSFTIHLKNEFFLISYFHSPFVNAASCDVIRSFCAVIMSLCALIRSLCAVIRSIGAVIRYLCVVIRSLCVVIRSLCCN